MALLAESETEKALLYYKRGWSLQEITENILEARNAKIRHETLKEVGVVISKRFQRQMYPVEFYGKLEIKGEGEKQ